MGVVFSLQLSINATASGYSQQIMETFLEHFCAIATLLDVCAQTMAVRVGCSQIRTRELTSCRRSIQNMGNAYTALCSIRRSRTYCTSRTIVAFIRVSTGVMIGSIYNTTCLPNLAFQSH